MPLPGGDADKAGNRYELVWTVRQFADVMLGRADRIRIEPPREDDIEFWVDRDGRRQFHQVKRQVAGKGKWSLATLRGNGVLADIKKRVAKADDRFVFVSTEAAGELHELAERANGAASTAEFTGAFLSAASIASNFSYLCGSWNCSADEAFTMLRRVNVETIGEGMLRAFVDAVLAPAVNGTPSAVRAVLAQHALESLHQTLTATDLWSALKENGHEPTDHATNQQTLLALARQTASYLASQPHEIHGTELKRDEAREASDALAKDSRVVFLVGDAGAGKTCVTRQIVQHAAAQDWSVLPFRADRLDRTTSTRNVGMQLGLPESPSVVLAGVAQGGDALLVIDQLDATSSVSGRDEDLFEAIDKLIRETKPHENIRVLVVCRAFDLEHDHRFRQLRAREKSAVDLRVRHLDDSMVQGIVERLGLDADRLTPSQLKLLALPLHLVLLAETTDEGDADALDFRTSKDLFDRFWSRKRRELQIRLGRQPKWTQVIRLLCDALNSAQSLHAKQDVLLDHEADAEAMASAHVLAFDRGRASFFHETFFDYAFARLFCARGDSLLNLLTTDEQHLFRRAQVRQVLQHRRADDFSSYVTDLEAVLHSEGVRFHVKRAILQMLNGVADPKAVEWTIIQRLRRGFDDPMTIAVRHATFDSAPWLHLLNSLGVIRAWLDSEDPQERDEATFLLRCIVNDEPDVVARSLEPCVGRSDDDNNRVAVILQWWRAGGSSRPLFDVFLRLLDSADPAEVSLLSGSSGLSSILHDLAELSPALGSEAIGRYLRRLAHTADERDIFDGRGASDELDVLVRCARSSPAAFLEHLQPLMLELVTRTSYPTESGPALDSVWEGGAYELDSLLSGQILNCLVVALCRLSEEAPSTFRVRASELAEAQFRTTHTLLLRVYAKTPADFAPEGARYLRDHWAEHGIWYSIDECWLARRTLENIAPDLGRDEIGPLEAQILKFFPKSERRVGRAEQRGQGQHFLLGAIPAGKLGEGARKRIRELSDKFDEVPATRPPSITAGYVRSPIPRPATERMSDDAWLSAIQKYDSEDRPDPAGDFLKGGATSLAQEIEHSARADPERFARLCSRIPSNAHPSYFDAILRGVQSGSLEPALVNEVCAKCHDVPRRPCGRWICDVIAGHAELVLPAGVFEILEWYALSDPDPDPVRERWRDKDAQGGPLHEGINSVRGRAAQAVAHLLFKEFNRLDDLRPALEALVDDPAVSVRACVADACGAVMQHDASYGIALTLRLVEADDALLGTHNVERLVSFGLRTAAAPFLPILERMLRSADRKAAVAGARQACLAALHLPEAAHLVEHCLRGAASVRLGAAEVFAANVANAELRHTCIASLCTLFEDEDSDVRGAAARCFLKLKLADISAYRELIAAFIDSKAFAHKHYVFFRALETTSARLPDVLLTAALRFASLAGTGVKPAGTASTVGSLVLRAYRQADTATLESKCLDAIDQLVAIDAYGIDKGLAEFDR